MSRKNLIAIIVSVLVALVLAWWIVGLSTSFQDCRDPHSGARQEQSHNSSEDGVAVFPIATTLRDCVGFFSVVNGEAITAIATLLLAAVTGGLIWLGLVESDTRRAELRAYVFVDGVSLFDASAFPSTATNRAGQAGITITIKNTGATPAVEVIHWGEIDIKPVTQEWSLNAPIPLERRSLSVISPGGINNKNRWLNRPVSAPESAGVQAGTHAIYAYGRIEYRDVFGDLHTSTYRMRYTESFWPPVTTSGDMTFCDAGNDAD